MTHFDPNGTDGATISLGGTTLAQIVVNGAGAGTYEADYGMERGNEMGVRMVAPLAADGYQLVLSDTANAWGALRGYLEFPSLPVAGAQIFAQIRSGTTSSSALCGRLAMSTGGVVTVQDRLGATKATLNTLAINTRYQFKLYANPATATTGSILAQIYNDSDTLLSSMTMVTNADLGLVQPALGQFGDPTTATVTGYDQGMTQLTFVTGATQPTIAHIAKNVAPPPVTGNFPLVLVAGTWT